MRRLLTCLVTAATLAGPVRPASAQPPLLNIPRVSGPPVLERYLDGTTRPPGVEVTEFRQREPGDGVPASQRTAAYLSYDQQHLYVVFVCHDEPGQVRANMTRREAIDNDDLVALLLDTYQDGRRAYLFMANPLGVQKDGIVAEGQDDDYSYDTVWASEGRLTTDGYVVFFAIPFKSLRFSNEATQRWGIAVGRSVTRANETSFWPYITRRIAGIGQQMARLEGIESVSPGRNLLAIPYGSFTHGRFLDEDGADVTEDQSRIGLDAKAVIKDAVTADLTVNPDFSQVESDEPQVTVNQRFEVFFPEKRPFFIENAGYFETPQALFFSRRVADPAFGGRVTGKSHGWAFGGLLVDDDEPGREVPEGDPRRDESAGIGVVRVQREFARQSHLGGIFTDRELGPTSNRVYGVDGRWKMDDNWSLTAQWVGSETTDTSAARQRGTSSYAELRHDSRNFEYNGSFLTRSPDFQADLGFIPRVDIRQTEQEAGYNWFPKGRNVLRVGPQIEALGIWSYEGELQEWTLEPGFEIELPGQTEIGVRHWQTYELFEGLEFRRHSTGLYASSQWLPWLGFDVFTRWGTAINYYPAEGLAPFLANLQNAEASLTLRPTSQLRFDQTYLFLRLSARDEDGASGADVESRGDVFNNHILRSRVNYQFTRELSGRLILDYDALLPDQSLVSLDAEKRFNVDVLFTYLVNPWTAVYVGYTDAYENRQPEGLLAPPGARGGAPTTSVGRQVFAKISYLFRY